MSIKTIISLAVCLVSVAACSGGGPAADPVERFARACVTSSNLEEAVCRCVAQRADKELSPDGFAFLLASLEQDTEKTAELRRNLDMKEATEAGTFMTHAPASCAGVAGSD